MAMTVKLDKRNGYFARSPLFWFVLILFTIVLFAALSPQERILGENARIVYLHGAWVWASLATFLAAGLVGLAGLVSGRKSVHSWSRALGRTGLFFWITYLPVSIWAMQTSWNGLYLAEPRFRIAVIFSISGLLLQVGLTLLENPAWASAGNLAFVIALIFTLANTQNVMHPTSPMFDSNAPRIQWSFSILFILALLAAWQVTRFWFSQEIQETANSR